MLNREEKEKLLDYLIQFLRPEKKYPLLPGVNDPEAIADFIGIDYDEYKSVIENFDNQTQMAAQELLKEDGVQEMIENLPFNNNDTIVLIGDSVSDDRLGWFQIIAHALDLQVEKADFTWIDASLGSETSTNAMLRLSRDVLSKEPDWVFIALGNDDAQRPEINENRTVIPLSEFWENISTIEEALNQKLENDLVWITPTPPITEMMAQVPLFHGVLHEHDLQEFREVIAGKTGYIVDPTGARMGNPPEAPNYMSDGFHHSIAGHINTAREVIKLLSSDSKVHDGSKIKKDQQ